MRSASRARNSGSSSGPMGTIRSGLSAFLDRLAGWRARAAAWASAVAADSGRMYHRMLTSAWPNAGCCAEVNARWLMRHGRREMIQAIAPAMNVRAIMTSQVRLGSPRNDLAGVNAASVRQYSQQPARKRTNRTPTGTWRAQPAGCCHVAGMRIFPMRTFDSGLSLGVTSGPIRNTLGVGRGNRESQYAATPYGAAWPPRRLAFRFAV